MSKVRASIGAFCVLAASTGIAHAAAGDLDPSFGGDGVVITPVGGPSSVDAAYDIARQADGKLVVAGVTGLESGDRDFAVARYNANGTLDDSSDGSGFGGDGIVTLDVGGLNEEDLAETVAIQDDGKIVVAGYVDVHDGAGYEGEFAVVRFNPNGSVDDDSDGGGFTSDGIAITPVGDETAPTDFDGAYTVLIQPDDKIVAAGEAGVSAGGEIDFALVRYEPDGDLDPSFDGDPGNAGGGNGIVTTQVSGIGGTDAVNSLARQGDGKLVAGGRTPGVPGSDWALARYHVDGTLDDNSDADPGVDFGGDGKVITSFGTRDFLQDLAIQADGRIAAAGTSGGDSDEWALARYTPAHGALDGAFDGNPGNPGGGNGRVVTPFGSGDTPDGAQGLSIAPDGKLVVAGQVDTDPSAATEFHFSVARYTAATGLLDTGFSGDGRIITTFNPPLPPDGSAEDVLVQPDAKIVAVGQAPPFGSGSGDFALVRYLGSKPERCAGRAESSNVGTPKADVIVGTNGPNTIRGRGGSDLICGLGKRDRLVGGNGKDRLVGGKGADILVGGKGRDLLLGGAGVDILRGGSGRDRQRQ